MSKHEKRSDARAPHESSVPAPKTRPRRQEGPPRRPKGGPHASTRGGARKRNRDERETRDRGEYPGD